MARFNSLVEWLEWQEHFHPRSIDLGLKRATNVFKALNPQAIKPLTIIVAGTNGKGSCIAVLEAIYRAAGYRVGTYSSPHILDYNERIRINGEPVGDDLICQAFERIDSVRNNVSLSYFEFGTLAALDIFWQADLDIQLLEVGLGGRLDAVNIIDADVALISNISIDHIDWLGDTREAIAYEKAGIFRQNVPAILGDIEPPINLSSIATEKQTPLFVINQHFSFEKQQLSWNWHSHTGVEYLSLPLPKLKGEHQYYNAATVLMAISLLNHQLPVSEQAIRIGLQTTVLKGRFQLIDGDIPVLLDVAHNPQAVQVLLAYLQTELKAKKIIAIFSMMKDKDIKSVIEIIQPVISHWIFSPLTHQRTVSEAVVADYFRQLDIDEFTLGCHHFLDAYKIALEKAEKGDLIVIFGSFFLVSEYFAQIGEG